MFTYNNSFNKTYVLVVTCSPGYFLNSLNTFCILMHLYMIYNYYILSFFLVMYQAALPFIGFGFFDNVIMITAVSCTLHNNACVVM